MSINKEILIRDKLIKCLLQYLNRIETYGIDHIGYRYFLPDGKSYGFSTNDQWYALKDDRFYEEQKAFLITEINDLIENDARHIIRSLEETDNYYLKELKLRSMSNSLGIYNFAPNRIEHFFFISLSQNPFHFQSMIKYIKVFEKIADELAYLIPNAISNLNQEPDPEFYYDKHRIKEIFIKIQKRNAPVSKEIIFEGKNIHVTAREAEVLELAKLNYSNRMIAEALNISPRTVEKHVNSLKEKYGCDRNRIIQHANFQRFRNFNKKR